MTQIDHYWSFICESGEQYLDCKLITASGTYFTNRCFLQSSSLLKTVEGNEDLIISLPEFSYSDVKRELNGYITMRKIDINQGKTPTLNTMALGHINDQILKSCSFLARSDEINSQCSQPREQGDNQKKTKAAQTKSSEEKSPNTDPKSFQCDFCGLIFETSKKCRMHKYQVHTTNSFSCELCNDNFKTKSILGRNRQIKFIN